MIVVDGLDGCGKDTHAQRLAEFLKSTDERVTVISHPSSRYLGKMAKRSLEGSGPIARSLATMFFTLDVLFSIRWFKKQRSGTAIFVRYLMGTAYLPKKLAPIGYRLFRRLLPFPDIAFFIDIDPNVALKRIALRDRKREMFETEKKLADVRKVALSLLSDEWTIIDNNEDGEGPFENILRILKEILALSSSSP